MEKTVQDGRGDGLIAQADAPVFDDAVGGDEGALACGIPIHDDLLEIVGGVGAESPSQEQIIDDEQIGLGEQDERLAAGFELLGLERSELLDKMRAYAGHVHRAG